MPFVCQSSRFAKAVGLHVYIYDMHLLIYITCLFGCSWKKSYIWPRQINVITTSGPGSALWTRSKELLASSPSRCHCSMLTSRTVKNSWTLESWSRLRPQINSYLYLHGLPCYFGKLSSVCIRTLRTHKKRNSLNEDFTPLNEDEILIGTSSMKPDKAAAIICKTLSPSQSFGRKRLLQELPLNPLVLPIFSGNIRK